MEDKLNPDKSGPVKIEGDMWTNCINFIYASIVDCTDDRIKTKFCSMPVSELREATKKTMELDISKTTDSALEVAYAEKFKDPDLAAALLKTGTVMLKAPCVTSMATMSTAPLEEATVLMKEREKLSVGIKNKNMKTDEQIYIRRVKQSVRIYKAMCKMLNQGNSLDKFRYFSIASIPSELAHTGDVCPESVEDVAAEIKSAALSLKGNILYCLCMKNELRKYKNTIESLKSKVARQCIAEFIIDTKYPHFYKEAISKHTGCLKSDVHSIKLSLENSALDTSARRELIDSLEQCQNELRDKRNNLTKVQLYKKHSELLDSIPGIDAKVWTLYTSKKFPPGVQASIDKRLSHIYNPSELDIARAEGWTHRCQVFKSTQSPLSKKHEIGEYVISKKDFSELSMEYVVSMNIDGKCFSSAAHYVIFRVLAHMLSFRFETQASEFKAEQALLTVAGKFIGIGKSIEVFLSIRDETFELLLRNACKTGLEAWLKSSETTRTALKNLSGVYLYKSPNLILGVGPIGSDVKGANLVGHTFEELKQSMQ